jgi:hypothetical protein
LFLLVWAICITIYAFRLAAKDALWHKDEDDK